MTGLSESELVRVASDMNTTVSITEFNMALNITFYQIITYESWQ